MINDDDDDAHHSISFYQQMIIDDSSDPTETGYAVRPKCIGSVTHDPLGPITDMQVIPHNGDSNLVLTGSSWGHITVFQTDYDECCADDSSERSIDNQIRVTPRTTFHTNGEIDNNRIPTCRNVTAHAVTALTSCSSSGVVIAATASGSLCAVDLNKQQSFQSTKTLVSGPITKVVFAQISGASSTVHSSSDLLFTLDLHILRMWDTRSMQMTMQCNSEDKRKLHSLAVHPQQPNTVVTGNACGALLFWDIRQTSDVFDVQVHPAFTVDKLQRGNVVWQTTFVHGNGDLLISGTNCGTLDLWVPHRTQSNSCQFLNSSRIFHGPLPVMSLDIHPETNSICMADDSTSLYLFTNTHYT
jgi:hypothetical protein